MQRIGVFVCWCGSNIAGTVDVQTVAKALENEPGVAFSFDIAILTQNEQGHYCRLIHEKIFMVKDASIGVRCPVRRMSETKRSGSRKRVSGKLFAKNILS